MKSIHTIDEARLGIMLNERRLPTIKTLRPQFAEQADREAKARSGRSTCVHPATIRCGTTYRRGRIATSVFRPFTALRSRYCFRPASG
jgi:hypothetical protein